jgi:pyrroline-5-carboxylate reductase
VKLLLVGCGRLGGALRERLIARGTCAQIEVVSPAFLQAPPEGFMPDAVLFAVKPQVLPNIAADYKKFADAGALILSVAAGIPISFFETRYGAQAKIVRAMPNTPAAIGQAITALCANAAAGSQGRAMAQTLLSAAGETVWLSDESLMNAVTALSGSGPAYVFLLIETLARSGEKLGLPADTAMRLARQTVLGSAALAAANPNTPAETLRHNVTSPGGTTEAALSVLQPQIQSLFDAALEKAAKRAKELAG